MEELAKILIEKNIQIGSVESFTAGSFAASLGKVPGISQVLKGALVTYQTETKERILGISHDLIVSKGVVSKEVASLMAVNGKTLLGCDLCVSFTGNAGPDVMEGKAAGLVYLGIAYQDILVYQLNLTGTREEVQAKAISFIKQKLVAMLSK